MKNYLSFGSVFPPEFRLILHLLDQDPSAYRMRIRIRIRYETNCRKFLPYRYRYTMKIIIPVVMIHRLYTTGRHYSDTIKALFFSSCTGARVTGKKIPPTSAGKTYYALETAMHYVPTVRNSNRSSKIR
jgi:hypothetical protein